MLETKLIEVRDIATRIDIIAIKMQGTNESSKAILYRDGFNVGSNMIMVTNINSKECSYDPFDWGVTLNAAHIYIRDNWDLIPDNWVVDIETIKGIKQEMKVPERYNNCDEIKFRIKNNIEESDLFAVKDILKDKYNLNVVTKSEDYREVFIKVDEIMASGLKIYEVFKDYLDIQ